MRGRNRRAAVALTWAAPSPPPGASGAGAFTGGTCVGETVAMLNEGP